MEIFLSDFKILKTSKPIPHGIRKIAENLDAHHIRGETFAAIKQLSKQNTVIVQSPTGSGKSLIYLFFAAYMSRTVLKISPLRGLCLDQLSNARSRFSDLNHGPSLCHSKFDNDTVTDSLKRPRYLGRRASLTSTESLWIRSSEMLDSKICNYFSSSLAYRPDGTGLDEVNLQELWPKRCAFGAFVKSENLG